MWVRKPFQKKLTKLSEEFNLRFRCVLQNFRHRKKHAPVRGRVFFRSGEEIPYFDAQCIRETLSDFERSILFPSLYHPHHGRAQSNELRQSLLAKSPFLSPFPNGFSKDEMEWTFGWHASIIGYRYLRFQRQLVVFVLIFTLVVIISTVSVQILSI